MIMARSGMFLEIFRRPHVALSLAIALLAMPTYPLWAIAQNAESLRGIHYVTVRDRTGNETPERFYGVGRGTLSSGWCGIQETLFSALSPISQTVPFHLPDEFLSVDFIRETDSRETWTSLETSAQGRPVTLYIHGFFIDFEKGCRRATLFQENAGIEGSMLWFSWPSDGAIFNYAQDEADLYWSVPDIADQIEALGNRFGHLEVNVVGHSLGARGVALALYELASRKPEIRLGNVALLAPDMDFQRLLPRIRPIVRSLTVYYTDTDRPLALSARLQGYSRLGEAGNDFASLEGVEAISVSALEVRSPTGHLYHLYNSEVGEDLRQLLLEGRLAGARSNLIPTAGNIWALQRSK